MHGCYTDTAAENELQRLKINIHEPISIPNNSQITNKLHTKPETFSFKRYYMRLFMFVIIALVLFYVAYATIKAGLNKTNYSNYLEGKCKCIDQTRQTDPVQESSWNSYFVYTFKVINHTVCEQNGKLNYTFKITDIWSERQKYNKGTIYSCYSNKNCNDIFLYKEAGWIYFGASVSILFGLICCCCGHKIIRDTKKEKIRARKSKKRDDIVRQKTTELERIGSMSNNENIENKINTNMVKQNTMTMPIVNTNDGL
eukprot:538868_1